MSVSARVGERTYEFDSHNDLTKARAAYAYHVGDQNSFEDELEQRGVSFIYETDDLFNEL